MKDKKRTGEVSVSTVNLLADQFERLFSEVSDKVRAMDFYGSHFGMDRLGYMIVPYMLRRRISRVKNNRLKLEDGPFPPRKDGGFGWFIVEETADKRIC